MQEAKAKWPELIAASSGIALHLIGPLQINKAKEAVALFDAIHSVDRPSICGALAKEMNSQKRRPELLVSSIPGRSRRKRRAAPGEADLPLPLAPEGPGLSISGLMCIAAD